MMNKKFWAFLSSLAFVLVSVSCGDHYYDDYYDDYYYDNHHGQYHDDYHHDYHHGYNDGYYHYEDNNTYNYIRKGRWFLVSQDSYEQYIIFTDWEIQHYNWSGHMYDHGTYEYHDKHLHIHYDNGDVVEYHINKACDSELILRTPSGKEYRYVRRH